MAKLKTQTLLTAGLGALLALVLINAIFSFTLASKLDAKIVEMKELSRPPKISLTVIDSSCAQCFDIAPIVEDIRSSGANITEEKTLTRIAAKDTIAQFGITKLPAIIITGEVGKINAGGFELAEGRNDTLLFKDTPAPFYNVRSAKVEGIVKATLIVPDCEECSDLSRVTDTFKQQGVNFASILSLTPDDARTSALVAQHKIGKFPALILSDDISAYPEIFAAMSQGGFRKSGDFHIYEPMIPYVNATTLATRGLVDVTYLSDRTCTSCYDVKIHRQILSQFGIIVGDEEEFDISSAQGKQLVEKYQLAEAPAVIIKGDIALYVGFDRAWETVGTVEDDGSYIFRKNSAMGPQTIYRDLESGEVMGLESQAQAGSGASATI